MAAIVFYHHPCLDGTAAAWAAYEAMGEVAEYYPLDYNNTPAIEAFIADKTKQADMVYFLDYHPPFRTLMQLLRRTDVAVIDHHETTRKELGEIQHARLWKVIDMNHSGAMLAWKFFHPGKEAPALFNTIEAIDLHQIDRLGGEASFMAAAAALDALVPLEDLPTAIAHLRAEASTTADVLCAQGKHMADRQMQKALALLETATWYSITYQGQPLVIPFVEVDMHTFGRSLNPALCSLPNRTAGYTGTNTPIAIAVQYSEGQVRLNMRGNPGFDCAAFAEWLGREGGLGGGGHVAAAAARLTTNDFKRLFSVVS